MPFQPTPEQERILRHDLRIHARVLAGPGTGKSATVVALVEQILAADNPPRLKLLTFTRAATGELAKKVAEHPAFAAERPSTIHSFAISLLVRNPGAGGLPQPLRIADRWEERNVVLESLRRRLGISLGETQELLRELAANWESLAPHQDPAIAEDTRARFLGAWFEHRDVFGYTLLGELPHALRKALVDHPDLDGADFGLLIVDEYQDLNACDLDVISRLAARGCVVIAAGDDDQSIYKFRRAAPEGIRRFIGEYRDAVSYNLSVTQRCGRNIIDWATHVISGDPDRPRDRPRLTCAEGSPAGETALLSFQDEAAEATGVARVVRGLVERHQLRPSDILILLRSDARGAFSNPIREHLERLGIAQSNPDAVNQCLAEDGNRRLLAVCRLLGDREDSIAWASLLELTHGVGQTFVDHVYHRAREQGLRFGSTLLEAYGGGFADAPRSAARVRTMMREVLEWLDQHVPQQIPEDGWGRWIIENAGGNTAPTPSQSLSELLLKVDTRVELNEDIGRYVGQLGPMGADLAQSESEGVRIMTMTASKGLTVRATIVVGVEEGIIPRPGNDRAEDRRLLYVAMTRSKEFLYCTWARRRRGPTARAGAPAVGTARHPSSFFANGPVASQDGAAFLAGRFGG